MASDRGNGCDAPFIREKDPWIFYGVYVLAVVIVIAVVISIFQLLAILVGAVVPGAAGMFHVTGWVLGGSILLIGCGLVLSALMKRSLLPFPLELIGRINTGLFPLIRIIGRILSIPSIKIEQSFLRMHNRIVRQYGESGSINNLLVLLPHCLERGIREKLNQETESYPCVVRVVGGGSQARAVVEDVNPQAILAVACEKDLVSGVVELCGEIPMILAVPNIQSHGPCNSTEIHMQEFRTALEYFFSK